MTQPKDPPLSIRLGAERLARIEAYAKEHVLSRHLAILLMLDEGYRSLTKPSPLQREAAQVSPANGGRPQPLSSGVQIGPTRRKPGDLMKKPKR